MAEKYYSEPVEYEYLVEQRQGGPQYMVEHRQGGSQYLDQSQGGTQYVYEQVQVTG